MNLRILFFTFIFISSLMSSAIQADEKHIRMHVQISNETTTTCRLTSQDLLHGIFDTAPPQSILMNDSKVFDMEQYWMGPDVILTYTCNDKSIRFELQQDLAILIGHEPSLTVLEKNGLTLQSTSQSSSVFWKSPGIINIAILPVDNKG